LEDECKALRGQVSELQWFLYPISS
jgi:hypothetical protein